MLTTKQHQHNNGLKNFFAIFEAIVDEWMFIDNSGEPYELIAQKNSNEITIRNSARWNELANYYKSK
ncbi:hypothetical protein [Carboxylicivirga sp. RSCT41]|uniref:hypothetical protein n=1 Tax=Carboxylicivirga agarovorans TaxID=3417570 RepID=UPI003D326D95